jgi:hypothetical protein
MPIWNGVNNHHYRLGRVNRVIAGLLLAVLFICFEDFAHALNGFLNVAACPGCVTSTDFEKSAIAQAQALKASGTYLLSSTVVAESAYMQVTGHLKNVGDGSANPVWVFTGAIATPIDALGNSIATDSEIALQTFFSAVDTNTMGVSRNFPVVITSHVGSGPPSLIPNFIGSTDDGPGINSITNGLVLDNPSINDLTDGDAVTIR